MIDIEIIWFIFLWLVVINLEMEIYFIEYRVIWVLVLVNLYFLWFLCFEMWGDNNLKVEVLLNLFVILYDDEYNDKLFLIYNMIGICYIKVKNFLKVVEMFVRVVKYVKILVWMNENMNFGFLWISIVLNIIFREIRKY